ncbi:hypothetical protein [Synoicihabitans lomoniglobus]|uniref:Antitoxin n=1 Tax=Synoicihabitans lomoniglobus TaxID=2909285 RepID=A0AAE9ZWI3_9BACT|nr:hypothetical protein [Opitutaceae bacterium LMO-M01]WED64180.1 hypothetical protein PXH66_17730 [Opitutaceae bacterium LMO-M01]
MKTTIDLPDDLLHRAKITAAQRKTTLKELAVQGLEYAIRHVGPDSESARQERSRKLIAALSEIRITEPVGKFNREEAYDRQQGSGV